MIPHLYLIRAECPGCGDVVPLVEEREEPVPIMHDVEVSSDYCPRCSTLVEEWDVHEEAYLERAPDPDERGSA